MENLHEMGYRLRQKKLELAQTVAGIVAAVLLGVVLVGLVQKVNQINQALYARPKPDTVVVERWYGVKSARIEGERAWVVRVEELPAETKGTKVTKGGRE